MQRNFLSEITIKATRSGGKGGQNVNKVSSRIEVMFNVIESAMLTADEKHTISKKLKLSQDGVLRVVCDETRHQLKNKELAIEKLHQLIFLSLKKPKKRMATKPTRASKLARLLNKKLHSQKKENRREF